MDATDVSDEPMAQDWIEVQIESSVDAGELLSLLSDPAVRGAWQENGLIHLYWPPDKWGPDVLQDLRTVLKEMGQGVQQAITIDRLSDRDWNDLWARSVQPIRIGRRVVIRPSWKERAEDGDIALIIDPKQAFGTGHHATTRLLIEWLKDIINGGESVLDVGTGSGILAMLALRFGARSAIGIDHDPVAIDCARQYATVNGFGSELELRIATLADMTEAEEKRFDVILANLDRRTLMDAAGNFEKYVTHGARLLVSGLLVENRQEVADAFSSEVACVRSMRDRDGWLALEIVAPESCGGSSK